MFPVIEELSKHPTEMTDPTEIAQYMRDFHGGFLSTARANPAYTPVRTLLDQVGWLVSSVEGGRVQLRMYHSTHEFEPMWYEEGVPGSLLPIDMTAEQSLPAELELKRRLRICRHARDVDRTLDHNIKVIAHYFVRQSQVSKVALPRSAVVCQLTGRPCFSCSNQLITTVTDRLCEARRARKRPSFAIP